MHYVNLRYSRSISLEVSAKVVSNEAYGVAPDSLLYQQQPAYDEQPSAEYDDILIMNKSEEYYDDIIIVNKERQTGSESKERPGEADDEPLQEHPAIKQEPPYVNEYPMRQPRLATKQEPPYVNQYVLPPRISIKHKRK